MKKHLILIVMAIAAMSILTACTDKSPKEVTANVDDLAKQLNDETVAPDQLAQVSPDIIESTYFVDMEQIEESSTYMGLGATGCEISVIKCKDAAYTAEAADLLKSRAKNQAELYATYNAEEAKKLENAIVKTSGNYVVLCVVDDTKKAETILKDAGF